MNRQKLIDEISEQLAILTHKIKLQNGINLTDLNIHAENFFRDFLNLLHGFQLRNCNAENPYEAAIDLRDEAKRIAIQVTANSRREKIQSTIDAFCAQGANEEYDRLIILLLAEGKSYRKDFVAECSDGSSFVIRRTDDVWNLQRLIRDVGDLTLERLSKVRDFLVQELGGAITSRRKFQTELPEHRQLSRIISYGRTACFTIRKSNADAMDELQRGMERLQLIASIALYDTFLRTKYHDFVYLGSILAEEDSEGVTFSFEVTCHVSHFVTAYKELLGCFEANDDGATNDFDLNFRTVQPIPLTVAESVAYRGRLVGPCSIDIEIEKPFTRMTRRLRTSELLKLISQAVHHQPVIVSDFVSNDETTETLDYFARVNDTGTLSLDDFELDTENAERFTIRH
ncbi:MAG: SMEK domain-containing protein [Phycisphaera sp. RhM]|nr:SMEK domain-containing protein [Phycisphaera sp. RhM]